MKREKVGGRNGNMNFEVIRFSFFFFLVFGTGKLEREEFLFSVQGCRLRHPFPVSL